MEEIELFLLISGIIGYIICFIILEIHIIKNKESVLGINARIDNFYDFIFANLQNIFVSIAGFLISTIIGILIYIIKSNPKNSLIILCFLIVLFIIKYVLYLVFFKNK